MRFLVFVLIAPAFVEGCSSECTADADCVSGACRLSEAGEAGLCASDIGESEGEEGEGDVGEGEGEGEEGEGDGEGEGEGEGDPVIGAITVTINAVERTVAANTVVDAAYSGQLTISARATANSGTPGCTLGGAPGPLTRSVPTVDSDDETVVLRCTLDGAEPQSASVRLLPLAVALKETQPVFNAGDAPVPANFINTNTDTSAVAINCSFEEAPDADRSSQRTISCTRGTASVDKIVQVSFKANVVGSTLRLSDDGSDIAVDIEQTGATSCQVTCAPGDVVAGVENGIDTNGTVAVTLDALAAGDSECTVSCVADDGVVDTERQFTAHSGNVTSQTELDLLRTQGVDVLDGDIGPINPSLFDLGNPGTFSHMTGSLNVQCGGGTSNLIEVRALALEAVGGDVIINNCDRAGSFSISLGQLAEVGGSLSVVENLNLAVLQLDALETIGGTLAIELNPNLIDFSFAALDSVPVSVGADISISDNVKLDCAQIDAFVCALDPNPTADALRNDADNNNDAIGENCTLTPTCLRQ